MNYQRVLSAWEHFEPRIPRMVDFFAWYERDNVAMMLETGRQRALTLPDELAALPPGQRVIQLRWLFVYEAQVPRYHSDPVGLLERGYVPTARTVRMLRPLSVALKKRNLIPDAIWIDTEAGVSYWGMSDDQMRDLFSRPRARAKMPPSLRSLDYDRDFNWYNPNIRTLVHDFNVWCTNLMTRALKAALVDSGLFTFNTPSGRYVPPMCRYIGMNVGFPIYDPNGWPMINSSIDGRTTNMFQYQLLGYRYNERVHDPRWNLLIDIINWTRSFLNKPNSLFWPLVQQPKLYYSDWYFEQMIAHMARTGVTTPNGNGWIYWNEHDTTPQMTGQATKFYEAIARHDQNFPVQRNLPPIELDADRIETAGYVTTYTDFLNNVP